MNSGNANLENFTYDGYGNQTSATEARGTVTTSHYDSNSLYLTSQVVNSNNNLGTRSRTTTYSFDFNTGLKTVETDADNGISTTFPTTGWGAMTSETYPSGRVVTTSYDQANRAIQVTGKRAAVPRHM